MDLPEYLAQSRDLIGIARIVSQSIEYTRRHRPGKAASWTGANAGEANEQISGLAGLTNVQSACWDQRFR